jgi:glycosyltransferase involved in cell wall biosynthesis
MVKTLVLNGKIDNELLVAEVNKQFIPKNEFEIAQALRKLSKNTEQTLAMGRSARASFEANYNWEKETRTLSAFYLSI